MDLSTAQVELSTRKRAEAALRDLDQPGVRWTKLTECRWLSRSGFTVIASAVTGATYLVAEDSAAFYRTVSPEATTRLTGCSPREVIREDRAWLFPLFDRLPVGPAVLRRYLNGSHKEDKVPTPANTPAAPHPMPAEPSLSGLSVKTAEKRILLVETTKTLELRPDQVIALARRAGLSVPDKATVSWREGYVRLSWTESKESVEE